METNSIENIELLFKIEFMLKDERSIKLEEECNSIVDFSIKLFNLYLNNTAEKERISYIIYELINNVIKYGKINTTAEFIIFREKNNFCIKTVNLIKDKYLSHSINYADALMNDSKDYLITKKIIEEKFHSLGLLLIKNHDTSDVQINVIDNWFHSLVILNLQEEADDLQ